jgi:tellurite resistance protein
LSGLLSRFSDQTRKVFARHNGKSFIEGAMGAAALIAIADGDASVSEGAEVGRLMRVMDVLKEHKPDKGIESYIRYVDLARNSPEGVAEVRNVVQKAVAEDGEAAALLIVICHAVSEADGFVRQSELDEINRLAALINVDPDEALEMIAPLTSKDS